MAEGHTSAIISSAIFLNTKKCNLETLPPFHSFKAFENFYSKDFLTKPRREEIFSKTLTDNFFAIFFHFWILRKVVSASISEIKILILAF